MAPRPWTYFLLFSASAVSLFSLNINAKKTTPLYFKPGEVIFDKEPVFPSEEEIRQMENLAIEKKREEEQQENGAPRFKIYGGNNLSFSYGRSQFLSKKDSRDPYTLPASNAVSEGFAPGMDMKIKLAGEVEDHVFFDIDYDQQDNFNNNEVTIQYRAKDDKKFVQEITFGKIDLNMNRSELLFIDSSPFSALGIDMKFKQDKWDFEAVGSISESIHYTETFQGYRRDGTNLLPDYEYRARTYYQLEPFYYYDDISVAPSSLAATVYTRGDGAALFLFCGGLDHDPKKYVAVDPGSLEIYIDDRNPRNDTEKKAFAKSVAGTFLGNYHRLRESRDFSVHYRTGQIRFVSPLPPEARVFVRYTRNNGSVSTSDPSARIVNGKIETFLRYGTQMHEDIQRDGVATFTGFDDTEIIPDGVVNLDVYEVRGIYNLGVEDIQRNSFHLDFVDRSLKAFNSVNPPYTVDYKNGLILFADREPFRSQKDGGGSYVYTDAQANEIYAETRSPYINENALVYMRLDYEAQIRSFQLANINIVPRSESVRINNIPVDSTLYHIDYQTGFFRFIDPQNPLITEATQVEIQYDYLPLGPSEQSYVVGFRTQYHPFESLTLGGSVYYDSQIHTDASPYVGSEPEGNLVFGGDARLSLNEKSMTKIANVFTKRRDYTVPVEIDAYGEYARSVFNPNTVGTAIVDDMESSEDVLMADLTAGKWVLGSIAPSSTLTQCNRAPLYYEYYFDPKNLLRGLLSFDAGSRASPAYVELSGPYNVAEGSLSAAQLDITQYEKQTSLVFDFDFSKAIDNTTPFVSAQTDNFGSPLKDVTGMEYIEISVMLTDTLSLSSGVTLKLDLGAIKEDADDDGSLDGEDIGLDGIKGDANDNNLLDPSENWDNGEKNGVIDYNRATGNTEDKGYAHDPPSCIGASTVVGKGPDISGFPSTTGNGFLNSEDINKNGLLDSTENALRIDPAQVYVTMDAGKNNIVYPGNWTKVRFYFNFAGLSEAQKSILKKVENLRLLIEPNAGAITGKGKLLVDEIKFGGTLWRNRLAKKWAGIGDSVLTDLTVLKAYILNTRSNKDEYWSDSFLLEKTAAYELLHGNKTAEELRYAVEGTLKLDYTLDATYESAYATRLFQDSMDISFYKFFKVWVNHRSFSSNLTRLVFRLGSSESDYYEYSAPIQKTGWNLHSFALNKPDRKNGSPDLRGIRYMAVGIRKDPAETGIATGVVWVNDIFVSDPEIISDYAYLYSGELRVNDPVITLKNGTPLFSDLQTRYFSKKKNYEFHSIGDNRPQRLEEEQRFALSTNIFPFWSASYAYGINKTDIPFVSSFDTELPGKKVQTYHLTNHSFQTQKKWIPDIIAGYEYISTASDIETPLYASDNERLLQYRDYQYAPSLIFQKKDIPLLGPFLLDYEISGSLSMETNSQKAVISAAGGDGYDHRQKSQMDLTFAFLRLKTKNFYITPSIRYSHTRLLSKNFTDNENIATPHSNFYFPLFSSPAFRYQNRFTELKLESQIRNFLLFSPLLKASFIYKEDNFADRFDTINLDRYQRTKRPSSFADFTFYLPLREKLLQKVAFLESMFFYFDREIILEEKGLPFSNMAALQKEGLGLSRVFPLLSDRVFNLVRYPFWYFMSSPENSKRIYSRGRDYVKNVQYDPGKNGSSFFQQYDNSFFLKENGSASARWILAKPISLQTSARIAHVVFRENLYGLPIQNIDYGYTVTQTMDMNSLLKIWPWNSPNKSGSFLTVGLNHDILKHITENIEENIISPLASFSYSWFNKKKILNGFALSFSFNRHSFSSRNFLSAHNEKDLVFYEAIANSLNYLINRIDYSYHYQVDFFTEIPGIRKFLVKSLKMNLQYNPKYNISLSADFNRFDYEFQSLLDRQALDQYIFNQFLDVNLHRNVNGVFSLALVYDIHRNPVSNHIMQEVFSYQLGFSANLLF